MTRVRSLVLVGAAAGVLALTLTGQPPAPAGARMADAAKKFLAGLDPAQKKKAHLGFDDKHRTAWYFTPQQDKEKRPTRVGLRLDEMTPEQKTAALGLLRTGLSEKGYEQATTIMSLEGILADLEGPKGAMVRNPGWYFVTVFGDPSATGGWSWRFEGHHLSANYTLDKGEVVSATPLLFGANPAEVKGGPRQGLRTLPAIEDHAKALIKSLSPEQDRAAKQPKFLPEIKEGGAEADVGPPVGVTADKLSAEQRATLGKLLDAYAGRLPEDLAEAERKRAAGTPPAELYFAYAGSTEPGVGYTYRVRGNGFVVEFLNVQADSAKNPANHIHSAWRRLPADFGVARK
ncbi:MAG: DUF3500 domain-containing protein [Gemmataceae bacterium]|nr:DUF3500 domain-containing protein [Gemmataceae bacterium]